MKKKIPSAKLALDTRLELSEIMAVHPVSQQFSSYDAKVGGTSFE